MWVYANGYTVEELLSYLEGKPLLYPTDLNQILKQIKLMPLSQMAMIAQAAVLRLNLLKDEAIVRRGDRTLRQGNS